MTAQDFQTYGLTLLQGDPAVAGGSPRYYLYEKGGFGQSSGAREVSPDIVQAIISAGIQPVNISGMTIDQLQQAGFGGATTGKANLTSLGGFNNLLAGYQGNYANQQIEQLQNQMEASGQGAVVPQNVINSALSNVQQGLPVSSATSTPAPSSTQTSTPSSTGVGGNVPQTTTSSGQPSTSTTSSTVTLSNGQTVDLGPFTDLYNQMNQYLQTLQQKGQVVNPNVTITPDQLASFTAQAAAQIHPYYATQLKAATDTFLNNLGYNVQQLNNQVQQAQTQYGRSLDTLAANSADQGFALSGIRQKQEGQLATDTQNALDNARSGLQNSATNQAAQFAQTYGGANVPTAPLIGQAPRVLPGQSNFDTTGLNTGLYTLSPDIYNSLIGSEQNAEKSATDTLSSQLATNYQQQQANNQTRQLNLT